ncbi:16S rRNA (guanine(966)-N(2))-methyltransferase RsmD, partial [bacterium]|nr:16S rRNA (guanine(966)-N(2))-methyltransferase RsmD [bacterium]
MRIIGGRWRGRPLMAPKGRDTRPTSDRVREAIFSSVYSLFGALDDVTVLDLYAGSGALGFEALSRGARRCVFVESDAKAAAAIAANAASLGIPAEDARVVRARVNIMLAQRLGSVEASLLLADPPYR